MTPVSGWNKRSLDAEFGSIDPEPAAVIPSVLSRWFVAFKEDVLSGRVSLEELIEVADFDMQVEQPALCPICLRSLQPGAKGYTHGVCAICWLTTLKEAHLEKCAELEALKDYNAAKKERQRLRDELGIPADRLRRPRVVRECASCGRKFAVPVAINPDETRCISCRELHERREASREGASDGTPR